MKTIAISLLLFLLVIPVRARETDPLHDDTRLLRKLTIQARGIPLKELLESLSAEAGIRLVAGPRVADDKVVLLAHDRPLVDSLRLIARFFNFTWVRSGEADGAGYTLTQTPRQARQEEAELDAGYRRAADQILKEARLLRDYAGTTPDEYKELLLKMGFPPPIYGDPVNRMRMPDLQVGAGYLLRLGREGIVRILRSPTPKVWGWPSRPGWDPMSPALRESIIKEAMERNAGRNNQIKAFDYAQLRIERESVAAPTLFGRVMAGSQSGGGFGAGFRFPIYSDYDWDLMHFPFKPLDWKAIPALNRSVALKLPSVIPSLVQAWKPFPPPLMASQLTALDESVRHDMISDAFFSTTLILQRSSTIPLGAALDALAWGTNHRWGYEAGFVMVRDRHYVAHRRREPALRDLRRWASLSSEALDSLNTLAEIAAQPYGRFRTTLDLLRTSGTIQDDRAFSANRGHLIFWSSLDPSQKVAALTPDGLPISRMTRKQRRLFEVASLRPPDNWEMETRNPDDSWPPGEMRKAVYAVEVREHLMWGFRTSNGGGAGAGTREEVFARLSKHYPQMSIDQLQKATSMQYLISYRSPSFRRMGLVWAPTRWSSGPGAAAR